MTNSYKYEFVRNSFYDFLQDERDRIIEELFNYCSDLNDLARPIEIGEDKNKGKTGKLQKVSIIDCQDVIDRNVLSDNNLKKGIERIWRINLEKEVKGSEGFKTSAKTTEIALLILKKRRSSKYTLYVILIELKTQLTIKEFTESRRKKDKDEKAGQLRAIAEKFRCSINRMCMLLTLNNHKNPTRGFANDDISIEFKGVIFYNTSSIDESKIEKNSDDEKMYRILQRENNLLTLKTILDRKDKMEIRFFRNKNTKLESMSIEFQEILEQLNII
ncbi:MAG: hypothetical protein AAGA60_22195 [Cyanobacteria bacterium P01_E01_bin.42]